MQEFQVDDSEYCPSNCVIALQSVKLSVIILTVKKHGCLTDSLRLYGNKADCGIVEFCHIVDYLAKLLIRKHIAVYFHFV